MDIVRTLAILAILSVHLGGFNVIRPSAVPWIHAIWYRIQYRGSAGVGIFFVVSGYVITRLLASRPQGLFSPNLADFYSRRVARLFPLLILTCSLGWAVIALTKAASPAFLHCFKGPMGAPFSGWLWVAIVTFSTNWYQIIAAQHFWAYGMHWDVLWSLAVEEQFYLIYPLVLRMLKNEDQLFYSLVGVIVFCFFANFLLLDLFPTFSGMGRNSFGGFFSIACGCLLYLVSEKLGPFLKARPKMSLLICGFGFALFAAAYLVYFDGTDYIWVLMDPLLLALGVFLFMLGGMHVQFLNSRTWAALTLPGRLSYGEYLFHCAIIYFMWPILWGMNEFAAFFLVVTVVTGIAWASYKYFEAPANHWVRSLFVK